MTLVELHLCAEVREAWTDVGVVGAGRRRDLRKIDSFSQILTTPGWTPPRISPSSRLWRLVAALQRDYLSNNSAEREQIGR